MGILLREDAWLRVLGDILKGFEGAEAEQGLNRGFCLSTFSLKLPCVIKNTNLRSTYLVLARGKEVRLAVRGLRVLRSDLS